jgi:hypothetical protein
MMPFLNFRSLYLIAFTFTFASLLSLSLLAQLPAAYQLESDWLLDASDYSTQTDYDQDEQTLTLENGLISRTWALNGDVSTLSFRNIMLEKELLRAIRPEVEFEIDGQAHQIGSSNMGVNQAYLQKRLPTSAKAESNNWRLIAIDMGKPEARFHWEKVRHHAPDSVWPPAGKAIHFRFEYAQADGPKLQVTVHYEMYDGIPGLSKWFTISNNGPEAINLDSFTAEVLAFVPYEDPVEFREGVSISPPDIHVETDYAFGGFTVKNSSRHSVHWTPDPHWKSQVNWARQTPSLLKVAPPQGPDQTIKPNEAFESFRVFELIFDSSDRERKGLALRRFYRTIAPWVTENPLTLHVVSTKTDIVKKAINQANECGFEMVSLSFGSGLNMEDETEENHDKFRQLTEYAKSKNIHLGGYSLLSSRRIKPDSDNIVNPETGKPGGQIHGFSPALASKWGQNYFRRLSQFFDETGFLQFTHDGSYPGDVDAASRPPLQKGSKDSQWVQWKIITDFYKKLRAQGAYVRVPDYYFLSGANESGMGYREVNWSLPREEQQIHTRQNIYDGTWQKTPSMGWMFVPLTQYHGGGDAATIEPLHQNLSHYANMLASNLGAGVQAVYRGHRLYGTAETKQTVIHWVNWFKANRDILESDIIHSSSRRANAQELDWFFHANSKLGTNGLLVAYNPLDQEVTKEIQVNAYYTGISSSAHVSINGSPPKTLPVDDRSRLRITITTPAHGVSWASFKKTPVRN